MYSAGSQSSVTLCDHLFYGRASFCLADAELTVNVWVDVCNCQMGWGGAEKEAEGYGSRGVEG